MCGVNGIFAYDAAASSPSEPELLRTRDHMQARGPDGSGVWWNSERRIGLAHRRLAILDLSPAAAQPMCSEDRDIVVTFNGEIYNYPALRSELESAGVRFRTHSDTEVLLHLFARDGAAMVKKLRGMFAFAIWDARARSLFLARDVYGIKPLYVSDDAGTFRFASQVKALLNGGGVSTDPEPAGIVGFHLWGSVPEPFTLFRSIRALPAGHYQWVTKSGPQPPIAFASIPEILASAVRSDLCETDAAAEMQAAFLESVDAHLLSDVEVGVFLSAGIDSGALLGLMRDAGQQRIRAITLAFDEYAGTEKDEAPLASMLARQFDAEHVVRRVNETEFHEDLPQILAAMDQPSIDGINTWFVAKAAREVGIKVALSGIGGDELLGGYPSFRDVPSWSRWMRVPSMIPGLGDSTRLIGKLLGLEKVSPKMLGLVEFGGSIAGAYFLRRGLFLPNELESQLDEELLRSGLQSLRNLDRVRETALTPNPHETFARVMSLESCWYMRNQLLRDTDWASMAHGVEIRTPLVDERLLRTIAPFSAYGHARQGKRLLANAPSVPLPADIAVRAKTGFTTPTVRWMQKHIGEKVGRNTGIESRSWSRYLYAAHARSHALADVA